jgi:hypothetical protein
MAVYVSRLRISEAVGLEVTTLQTLASSGDQECEGTEAPERRQSTHRPFSGKQARRPKK